MALEEVLRETAGEADGVPLNAEDLDGVGVTLPPMAVMDAQPLVLALHIGVVEPRLLRVTLGVGVAQADPAPLPLPALDTEGEGEALPLRTALSEMLGLPEVQKVPLAVALGLTGEPEPLLVAPGEGLA